MKMIDISLVECGRVSWIVCTFPSEEMRFEVNQFDVEKDIERRILLPDSEWSEWQSV